MAATIATATRASYASPPAPFVIGLLRQVIEQRAIQSDQSRQGNEARQSDPARALGLGSRIDVLV